ncbi:MAG: ABC transporter permease [Deltaproteobacteria bacterium]|nr:ABC transporter permease [Deltaproteobacteria bacterium]
MNLALAAIKNAIWIGWEMESNWTKKWIYFIYAAVRPMALCLILYFLYMTKEASPATDENFVAMYIGNAFFNIFIAVAGGISWVIIQDREHFRIIRYIYVAPSPFWVYIVGRATIVLAISLVSLAIVMAVGILFLGIPIGPSNVDFGLLFVSTFLGLVSATCVGLIFAGVCLITARHSMLMAEGAGAVFLLTCGILYPVDIMPWFAKILGYALPMTYWIELVRRAFGAASFSPALAGYGTTPMLIFLAVLSVIFTWIALRTFRACEDSAKRSGKLDQTTNY